MTKKYTKKGCKTRKYKGGTIEDDLKRCKRIELEKQQLEAYIDDLHEQLSKHEDHIYENINSVYAKKSFTKPQHNPSVHLYELGNHTNTRAARSGYESIHKPRLPKINISKKSNKRAYIHGYESVHKQKPRSNSPKLLTPPNTPPPRSPASHLYERPRTQKNVVFGNRKFNMHSYLGGKRRKTKKYKKNKKIRKKCQGPCLKHCYK